MSAQVSGGMAGDSPGAMATAMRLEVAVVPVADVDRAKAFYEGLGWRLDGDFGGDGDFRLVQLTPPGSNASIIFGNGVTSAPPGSIDRLLLAVDDLESARKDLAAHGAKVSEPFHAAHGGIDGGFHAARGEVATGPDPEHRSYATYASFTDPDGNTWVLQEITERLPGRVDSDIAALSKLLLETGEHHGAFEAASPPHDWWDWYAAYMDARQRGRGPDDAASAADDYMARVKGIVATR